ncbi:hypothetical protein KA082_00720 [Candidatus Woesebacteria bacterium]|nr:hypothetical protein [Candidatus Woesebacteria bacterium]
MTKQYRIAVAGSTAHTRICAEALFNHPSFTISTILTPAPKPIGREQRVTENPLHQFGLEHNIPTVLVKEKLDEVIVGRLEPLPQPDYLLVVDFGYFAPNWLLWWPSIAPINIHPSLLPRWRGSSPGQFTLLYGEKRSAVSIIIMNNTLDAGEILAQMPIIVNPAWTASDYYDHAFTGITTYLPKVLLDFANVEITSMPQPVDSPTPIAGRFTRDDGYIPYTVLQAALAGKEVAGETGLPPVLQAAYEHHKILSTTLECASRAFHPWPGLWTRINTNAGEKRMKLLALSEKDGKILLETVQVEGKQPVAWKQIEKTLQ